MTRQHYVRGVTEWLTRFEVRRDDLTRVDQILARKR